jgi:hypothetical protein
LGTDTLDAWTFVVVRTIACTIYSALLAYWMASWALGTPVEATDEAT